MSAEKTMLLVTSAWSGQKSFKLIPISNDCPYSEIIFDPSTKTLVIFSLATKEGLHMVPLRDENGDIAMAKGVRKNLDGSANPSKRYKEKQVTLETFTEHYITEKEDMTAIIELFASNANTFDYKKYVETSPIIMPETPKLEIVQP
jgi:hypothetical protein